MLSGKVALVTGAARGSGLAIARRLAQAGAAVLLADLDEGEVEQAARALAAAGLEARGQPVDVSSPEQVRAVVARALGEWGRVDILVNNAGICPITPLDAIGLEEWNRVLAVNLTGAFLCSQAVVPAMRAQGRGKIIKIASSAGQMGGLAVGAHYSASKAGLLGLTKSLARILAPAIQVNAVAPGTTETNMTRRWGSRTLERLLAQVPAGRLGRPDDVAGAVLFLASEDADYITGQTLSVNGGLLMI